MSTCVEGAEVAVLRSAKALLAAGRIRRVMVKVSPQRWHHFGIGVTEGLQELRTVFAGWRS